MSEQKEPKEPTEDLRDAVERAIEGTDMTIATPEELAEFMEAGQLAIVEHDVRAIEEGRRFLDEEQDQELIETWWREATECKSIDEAAAFAKRLITDYRHDYGTICHAIAAAGVAMAYAVENSPEGGVTGFQSGAIGWMLHKRWAQWPDSPRRMVDYGNLLFPQYDHTFTEISPSTAEWLVKEAEKRLAESSDMAHPDVVGRWKLIASGELPPFVSVEATT